MAVADQRAKPAEFKRDRDAIEFADRGAHPYHFALKLLERNPVEGMLARQDFDHPVEVLEPLGGRQVEALFGRLEESLGVLRRAPPRGDHSRLALEIEYAG